VLRCRPSRASRINNHWTNDGVWLVIVLFGVLSVAGLVAALFLNDAWVALILGRI